MKKLHLISFMALLIVSCQTKNIVEPSEIKAYGTSPLSHTIYIGSDNEYHHFMWSKGKISHGKWLVSKKKLIWSPEFPLGAKKKYFVSKNEDGTITPIRLSASE